MFNHFLENGMMNRLCIMSICPKKLGPSQKETTRATQRNRVYGHKITIRIS